MILFLPRFTLPPITQGGCEISQFVLGFHELAMQKPWLLRSPSHRTRSWRTTDQAWQAHKLRSNVHALPFRLQVSRTRQQSEGNVSHGPTCPKASSSSLDFVLQKDTQAGWNSSVPMKLASPKDRAPPCERFQVTLSTKRPMSPSWKVKTKLAKT